jgi:hypothetical protein
MMAFVRGWTGQTASRKMIDEKAIATPEVLRRNHFASKV